MVRENGDASTVKRNILNVGIVHENVHLAVANQVTSNVIEQFRLGLLGDFHTIGFDDFVHGCSKIGFGIAINLLDVSSE